MIIYNATKRQFSDDVDTNNIENIILNHVEKTGKTVGVKEVHSWRDSLGYMDRILSKSTVPENAGVSIEFHIPQTSKRIDFIVTGKDDKMQDYVVIIELKGWTFSELTEKDAVIKTAFSGGIHETTHPSYQAWTYASLIMDYNEVVYNDNIILKPCAYLHNYQSDGIVNHSHYQEHIEKAPLFLKSDAQKLRSFIEDFIVYGDDGQLMYRIEHGKIKPSKNLADRLASMLKGNQEFAMIDDQKLVYETALALAKSSNSKNKNVLIVEGGPGTGKSVVAVNLLVALTAEGLVTQYVTKNSAPRTVYESKLTGTFKKSSISNMFKGSGAYTNTDSNVFGALIVDEAHRLNEKSGMFKNLGENQIKEIINAAAFSIFFIDEDQRVTLHDIGEKDEIRKWAKFHSANVQELELSSQFRCNGSDGYIAWLDNILQIHPTANYTLEDYDFRVIDDPSTLRELIFEKNKINNKARLVAGYCYPWASKKNMAAMDIVFPEYDFAMQWNLTKDGMLWIVSPESVNEVGCIHTCQGLEVDYIGVIIGQDLIVRDGKVLVDPSKRAGSDSSVRGYKRRMKENPKETMELLRRIIKNTYRTLMTRGMKGCYVYCEDGETKAYFRDKITN